jgi:phospholipid/cholesterol/gamma-HCH transport system substrate-binding protein
MRSRTLREGSVGLLILLGLATFGGLFLWLRGVSVGRQSYQAIIEFSDIAGMQEGAAVRYRGVQVGNITKIAPGSNGVEITVDISPASLRIPRELLIEANQTGLIGETSIDIRPLNRVPIVGETPNPFDSECENQKIVVCNNSRLKGQIGVSLYDLLRNTTILAEAYSNPKFIANLNRTTENASLAASEIAKLSREFTLLSSDLRKELRTFSFSANAIASSANRTATQANLTLGEVSNTAKQFGNTAYQFNQAANEIAITANRFGTTPIQLNRTISRFDLTANEINNTVNKLGNTAIQVGNTVAEYRGTAAKFNELATSLNSLVNENRATLSSTLKNFDRTSQELNATLAAVRPTLNEFSTTLNQVNSGELVKNLETLSANAAQASANFRDLTSNLNDPKNLILLQQTLDSARSTMQNLQKITSDVDDLTGDPAFRDNLKNLVNGLGKLVSSSEQLQRQIEVGQNLENLKYQLKNTAARYPQFSPKISYKLSNLEDLEEGAGE